MHSTSSLDWLKNEIHDGLSKLLTLSLDRQPAHDVIKGTACMWLEALDANRAWDPQRDTPRIRDAFLTLAATFSQWPTPKHFLDALPPLPQSFHVAPRRLDDDERKRVGLQHIADIMDKLKTPPAKPHTEVDA